MIVPDGNTTLQHIFDSIHRLDSKFDQVQKDVSDIKEYRAGQRAVLLTLGTVLSLSGALMSHLPLIIKTVKGLM